MRKSIKLTLDGKEYTARLNDNRTVEDILNMVPMKLTLQRYDGHEYYSSLPKKPSIKGVPMTSDAHAGGIYYYDGWNAFTVLFGDAHIAPFEVVHIGDVNEDVISQLAAAGANVEAKIEVN
ncbi:cyclophilin-like fold protein [Priestia megaterium]|uniref:cyclophilin-like fold protein n=1 Tax=Priestia megaterium TaxID=1404 RepID=UPI0018CCE409|nr:cyclophilin-like fold protein [Priestia megaterium]MDD9793487.1 cyclophilin-like fold protein [Priestia megaterium]